MIGVGRHAPRAEKEQGFQRSEIFIVFQKQGKAVFFVRIAAETAVSGGDRRFFAPDLVKELPERLVVEIDIGQGSKKAFGQEILDLPFSAFVGGGFGQTDQRAGDIVLNSGGFGGFSADAGLPRTGFAAGGLFALITKHEMFHKKPP